MTDKEKAEERFEAKGEGLKVENQPKSNWDSVLKKYETKDK
jgi:hypothetical protein